jgi:hypothetical protein
LPNHGSEIRGQAGSCSPPDPKVEARHYFFMLFSCRAVTNCPFAKNQDLS